MHLWLIYNREDAEKNKVYIEMHQEECARRQIQMTIVFSDELSRMVVNQKTEIWYKKKKAILPDVAICRERDPMLSKHLEKAGVRVFNDSFVSYMGNHKGAAHQFLADKGIPMMDTCVCTKESYQEVFSYPVVVKSVNGHGGNEVFLVRDHQQLQEAYQKISSDEIVVQKVASEQGKDLRVYVIGKQIVACILRQSDKDFRSNFSLGGQTRVYILNEKERALVEKIIQLFDFGLVGIDFLFHNGEMVFNELEDVVGARMLYKNTNINLVGKYLDYILSVVRQ